LNILSLFDGMSCAQIAITKLGIKNYKYYASEIDNHAIKVAQANYPNTIQLGDVTKIKAKDLPKIDLLIAGSPCQGFSFAGKQLNFNDTRSALFFEFVRLLKELKPKYFLLENVKMKKEYQDVISDYLGVKPVFINSSLVSAQNRQRLYWCNWEVNQPEDKNIILADIIENNFVDRDKSYCIDANYFKGTNLEQYLAKKRRQIVFQINPDKSAGGKQPNMQNRVYHVSGKSIAITSSFGNRLNVGTSMSDYRKLTPVECERLQTVPDNYTDHVSNTQRYKMLGNGFTIDVIVHILKGALK
jgi:DNA-cytosine methyltransferase